MAAATDNGGDDDRDSAVANAIVIDHRSARPSSHGGGAVTVTVTTIATTIAMTIAMTIATVLLRAARMRALCATRCRSWSRRVGGRPAAVCGSFA